MANNISSTQKYINSTVSSVTVGQDIKATTTAVANVYSADAIASDIVASITKSMIDKDIAKIRSDSRDKALSDVNDQINNVVRSRVNVVFNSNDLIEAIKTDIKSNITLEINEEIKKRLNTKSLTDALIPLDAAIEKTVSSVNKRLNEVIKYDVEKEVTDLIKKRTSGLFSNVSSSLNDMKLTKFSAALNNKMVSVEADMTKRLVSNISDSVKKEQEKIVEIRDKIISVQSQIKEYEQGLRDKINSVRDQITSAIEAAEQKLVDDIVSKIKINF